jgi:hypothetical protein
MPITIKSHAPAHMLKTGDMIAIYAGNPFPEYAATLEAAPKVEEDTPEGEITLRTTEGRFSVPANTRLGVVAWAPFH